MARIPETVKGSVLLFGFLWGFSYFCHKLQLFFFFLVCVITYHSSIYFAAFIFLFPSPPLSISHPFVFLLFFSHFILILVGSQEEVGKLLYIVFNWNRNKKLLWACARQKLELRFPTANWAVKKKSTHASGWWWEANLCLDPAWGEQKSLLRCWNPGPSLTHIWDPNTSSLCTEAPKIRNYHVWAGNLTDTQQTYTKRCLGATLPQFCGIPQK